MDDILKKIPAFVDRIKEIQEVLISNIVLIGQTPAPTFHEQARTEIFLERLSDAQADYCATDDYNIPISIIKGNSESSRPPIFVVAHIDTFMDADIDHNYIVRKTTISGPGILDNSLGVAVLASLPVIFKHLDIEFQSDIVLAGVPQSIGKGNLQGIRHLLDTWDGPIRGAVIVEGEKLGRLNYYSEGIIRGEITCNVSATGGWEHRYKPNAIIILNKVIDEILAMELPQRPRARVIIGKINGGFKHGVIAYNARLGFEIQSDSEDMVKRMHAEIEDIISGIRHENHVSLELNIISNLTPATLRYKHPLVKNTVAIMKALSIEPASDSSESELSIFLGKKIPAVTLGVTEGKNVHLENASMKIKPMFTGIAQIIGVIMAIDSGVCDES
ncbi:MAG: peptidase dimerization domain-containing protein [Desulfobacteraceae bacterium]|jgi:tripeptide aminopeptidase|nr:peptidase dimerization domain-containing protein [Desulfobacteraceae bacterium]